MASTAIGNALYTVVGGADAVVTMKKLLFTDDQPPVNNMIFNLQSAKAADLLLIQLGFQRFTRFYNAEMHVDTDKNFYDDYGSTIFTLMLQLLTQCLRPRFACTSTLLFSTPLLPCLISWLEHHVGCPLLPPSLANQSTLTFASSTLGPLSPPAGSSSSSSASTSSAPTKWQPKDPASVISYWLATFGISVPIYTLVRPPLLQVVKGDESVVTPDLVVPAWLRSVQSHPPVNGEAPSHLALPTKIPAFALAMHLFAIMYAKLLFVLTEDELRTIFPPFGSVLAQRIFTKLLQVMVFELVAFESVFVPAYGASLAYRLPSILVGLSPAASVLQTVLRELYRRDVRLPFMVLIGTSTSSTSTKVSKDKNSNQHQSEDPNSLGSLLDENAPSMYPFFAPPNTIPHQVLFSSPFSSLPLINATPWVECAIVAQRSYKERHPDATVTGVQAQRSGPGGFSRQEIVEELGRAWLLNESWWLSIWTTWLDALTTRQRYKAADAPVTALANALNATDRSMVMDLLGRLPFAVRFEQRVLLLRSLVQLDKAHLPTIIHPLTGVVELVPHDITIRRGHVMEDGLEAVSRLGRDFKGRVRVKFIDAMTREEEKGVDAGGPFKEFLETVVADAFSPELGLFLETAGQDLITYSETKTDSASSVEDIPFSSEGKGDGSSGQGSVTVLRKLAQSEARFRRALGRSYYPNPAARVLPDNLALLQFVGRVVGKALYEGILLHVPLAPFFLCKVIGQPCVLSDLQLMNKKLYDNLMMIKTYAGDVEDLYLSFSVDEEILGEVVTRELKPNGFDIPVTNENKIEYIYALADYHLNRATSAQARAFISGLADVIDLGWLRMFNVIELQLLLSGSEETIDVDDWEANTVWQTTDGSAPDPKLQKWFWHAVRLMTDDERSSLLKFATCCSRPPLGGFRHLNPPFTIRIVENASSHEPKKSFFARLFSKTTDKSQLPSASTCFNILNLPKYESKDQLVEKLKLAILATGFHLT